MATITASVGRNGVNRYQDVVTIQKLLNAKIGQLTPLAPLVVDGKVGSKTYTAIEEFQRRIVKLSRPDGRVDPGGRTLQSLNAAGAPGGYPGAPPPAAPAPAPAPGGSNKSGSYWVSWANIHAKNSSSLDDLSEPFRSNTRAFIDALKAAGASVSVKATLRHPKRAYLFHWCWKIGLDKCQAWEAPAEAGVPIQWNHGDAAASKQGALEMINGFRLAVPPKSIYPPSLTSRHISGNAVDMDILWNGTINIKNKNGVSIPVTFMTNVNTNTALHQVGATYGVKKLTNDAPHWSDNGR